MPGANGANGSVGSGIGGRVTRGPGSATLKNTIVANSAMGGNCSGVADGGHNLEWNPTTTCGFTANAPKFDVLADPVLGGLTNNGGSTLTIALGTGSAAIRRGDPTVCAAAIPNGAGGVDQRGIARPVSTCSMGAYEPASNARPGQQPNGPNLGNPTPLPMLPKPSGPNLGVPNPCHPGVHKQ